LYSLPVGQNSKVVIVPYGTGYALAIIKSLEDKDGQIRGAHIIFKLKDLDEVLNDRKEQQPYKLYMNPVEQ
jgi:hypothetical protein